MAGIAYCINGEPRIIWPAVTQEEVYDDDGNPTGEVKVTDTTQERIAALPPGTDYALVSDGAEADAWWQAHKPVVKGIAYIVDGQPCLTWPVVTETTAGDMWETHSTLDKLIAALPPGTAYELLSREEAKAWIDSQKPAKEKILAAIAALEATQTQRMVRGAALGKPEDVARLAAIEAEIAALRAELVSLEGGAS